MEPDDRLQDAVQAVGGTVLVVDDERDVQAVISIILGKAGFRTMTASSGREALDKVRENAPDIVLLDYMMPGMNGLDTLKEIRKLRPETAVVIVTGRGSESTAADSIKMGADDYIAKPFDNEGLVASVKRVLGERREKMAAEQEEMSMMSRMAGKKRLGDVLVAKCYATVSEIEDAVERSGKPGKRIGQVLVEDGVISEEQLARSLAYQYGAKFVNLFNFHIEPRYFEFISYELMDRYQFVPYDEEGGRLVVAVSDPSNIIMVDELELLLSRPLSICVATRQAITEALKRSEGSQRVLKEVTEEFKLHLVKETDEGEETLSMDRLDEEISPIIRLVDTILFSAVQKRASDIHIESDEKFVIVKYRIDGVLYQAMDPIDFRFHSTIISRIKIMSELDIAEKRIPQDGRFKIRFKDKKIDFRVSIMPAIFGEDVVIRILDKESITADLHELRLERLGYSEDDLKGFRKAISEPYGMVLVTGPTGSGKTTTLYAAVSEINSSEDKIITIEDPVEYQLPGVVQIPVNEKKGLTFARGLRSILRHDPDKIMVGEIRDSETAQIAVQSALTGHLVFTTVHANNAFDVIGRFTNMGVEPYNFVSSLNCILAQRLIRTICQNCKAPAKMSRQLIEDSGLDYEEMVRRGVVFYEGKGCSECNGTGYKGRKAITEFLDLTDRIREMILDRRPNSEMQKVALEEGMSTLRQSALKKVFAGDTTLREINRVTFVE
ncbi:MAG: Flp pilus assembly complex ATPase component TadA [Nitrospirae bacterium]|nr:Flp pilus assembly complex ATPase component TadA [Nitrospirota bacterium]MBI5695030.1 Flp pilus assembly complex ATPase component TadA [Nitrospirota bacterium]